MLDGSDEASLIALKASAELDSAAELLTNADEENRLLAEQRIEDALEAILDAEIAGNEDSVSNNFYFLKYKVLRAVIKCQFTTSCAMIISR